MDGHGLSDKVHHEQLQKKTKMILYLVIHFIVGGVTYAFMQARIHYCSIQARTQLCYKSFCHANGV